ncbi:SusD/RagB family nutrient-binding outer membrane lipoprotein [Macellibacteroides fermentans]|uniref:SusD/RagB family nutrient-binding outer membrane lipoprotein n=1 Tax=Macellibacteroides fermentans TaxID=879969 RepID=UPI002B3DA30A|nr:SusD/RagB family nutrient-binding outer membrane lipoprotein [Macellibacteroides fermentans]
MKRIKNILCGLLLTITLLSSCTSFDELNTDPIRLQDANPGTFLNPILYEMSSYNWNRYNSYTFAVMQSKVATNSTSGVGWYNIGDGEGDGTWTNYYKWLNNIREMEKQAIALNEPNYQAISITLRSWIYQLLTDAFGDVPMTEASRGNEQLFTPKFDSQQQIYQKLIDDLEIANSLFDEASGLRYNKDGELLYETTAAVTAGKSEGIARWRKFANSLRLRILLRVANVPVFNAKAELAKMINNPTVYPVFQSNDDAAMVYITGVFPQDPPMIRPQDLTAYIVVSDFFVDNLQKWNDPRLPIFITQATNNGKKSYIGWPSGYDLVPSFNASAPNQGIAKAPMQLALMTYAELEFIKAELALKGIAGSDAKGSYEKGVKAAIEQWGGVMPASYFEDSDAAYDGTLDRIMLQKFYALIFCDYQQWFEHNRTGLPELPRGAGIPDGNQMPKRFKYPATLQRTNLKNYQIAKENMGGDDVNISLIWQKK